MEKRFSVNLRHRLLFLVSAKCLRALLAAFDGPWKLKFQRTAGWAASSRFLMASLRYRVCHVGQLLPGLGARTSTSTDIGFVASFSSRYLIFRDGKD